MTAEPSQPEVPNADGGAVQGYVLRTETGDLYAIPLAELERFRLSTEQGAALQAATAEEGGVQGYSALAGLSLNPFQGMTINDIALTNTIVGFEHTLQQLQALQQPEGLRGRGAQGATATG